VHRILDPKKRSRRVPHSELFRKKKKIGGDDGTMRRRQFGKKRVIKWRRDENKRTRDENRRTRVGKRGRLMLFVVVRHGSN